MCRVLRRVLSLAFACCHFVVPVAGQTKAAPPKTGLEVIQVSKDRRGFVRAESKTEFKPWGFNYDHDAANRLLETYWESDWGAVEGDFQEMKALGANTVRIHFQVSRIMKSAREPKSALSRDA